jgi:hypothetical protein
MSELYSKLESYYRTVDAMCNTASNRKDKDEEKICETILIRLRGIIDNTTGIEDVKNYTDTLKCNMKNASNGTEYQFYKSVRARLKDIVKTVKKKK